MKIGIAIEWMGDRAERYRANASQRTGLGIELVFESSIALFQLTREYRSFFRARMDAQRVIAQLPPVPKGLERSLYVWEGGSFKHVIIFAESLDMERLRRKEEAEAELDESDRYFAQSHRMAGGLGMDRS